MKARLWTLLLVILVLGVGWTSRVLTEQARHGGWTSVERKNESRGGRRGSRGLRSLGPFLGSVNRFANELDLTEEQREELTRMVEETTGEVRRRELEIRDYLYSTKSRVNELLTVAQRQRLDELNERQWAAYMEERRRRSMEWFRRETRLEEPVLVQVETILGEYHEARAVVFRSSRSEGRGSGSPDRRSQLTALQKDRDARLRTVITEEDLERYLESGADRARPSGREHRRPRRRDKKDGRSS
jgi:hypothetical protein